MNQLQTKFITAKADYATREETTEKFLAAYAEDLGLEDITEMDETEASVLLEIAERAFGREASFSRLIDARNELLTWTRDELTKRGHLSPQLAIAFAEHTPARFKAQATELSLKIDWATV